jgi:hypothetical protein
MKELLNQYIRAGYPGVYIVSCEEARVEAEVRAVAEELQYSLYAWSATEGLIDASLGTVRGGQDPEDVLAELFELPEQSIMLMRDLHMYLENPTPSLVRGLKDLLRANKAHGKVLILAGCRQVLPAELEHEMVVLHFALPGKEELGVVLDNIAASAKVDSPQDAERERLLDAARGLTTSEAENAFALSLIQTGEFSHQVVNREKANALHKNGLLEIVPPTRTLDNIGGLDCLKAWLLQRRDAFGARAREYGLPSPRGLLIIGIPGTGKSLTAKASASVFQRPLLRLDAGRLFAGLVGQSEANLRSVIQTAEAMAPTVLWIDEIEKGFSGSKSSGSSDGGTANRVFGGFVSWMQERSAPVFVVATANDVTQLPPEFLRKGRFDDNFFVDLPNHEEREAIWRIQIARYKRDPQDYPIPELAAASDGMTGAEIEQAFIDALYAAFPENHDPTLATIKRVLEEQVPLSRLMAEQMAALRKWASGRARPASAPGEKGSTRKVFLSEPLVAAPEPSSN